MMEKDAKIYVAGHRGMVGSAILRELKKEGYHNFVLRTHKELNLCRQDEVEKFFEAEKPKKNRIMYSWQRPKWAVSWQIRKRWRISCMTI